MLERYFNSQEIYRKKMSVNHVNKLAIASHWGRLLSISNFIILFLVSPVMAESELLKTLTVTGIGTEQIEATLAEVELGVEFQGKTASQVQQEIARRTTAVINLLRSEDVEQLQTTGIRLIPNYERSERLDNRRILIGYTGINTVSFQIQTDRVGTLLDEAVRAGASRIDRVGFTATSEAIATAQQEALRQASLNAQTRADVVLDTLNLTSQEIVSIQVDNAVVPQPRSFGSRELAVAEADTQAIGGEQTVRASVTLEIGY